MADNNFREGITGQGKRLVLDDCFFLCFQSVGGLNVGLFTTGSCNKVDFSRNRRDLSVGVFLIAVDDI